MFDTLPHRVTDLPFFAPEHAQLARGLNEWASTHLRSRVHTGDVDAYCQSLVRQLGDAGWLRWCVPQIGGGALPELDSRSLCLARQTLGYYDGLADFAFAMQGLGSGPISLFGTAEQQAKYLPAVAQGRAIAAFALSEPEAGSDAAAMQMRATRQGNTYRLNGVKTWISNAGIADFYTVFARTENDDVDGVTAFVVDANTPGLTISERFDVCAPHPIGSLTFHDCVIADSQRLSEPGRGFKVAMQTLDVFPSVCGCGRPRICAGRSQHGY
jgi:acyl-CoA dehydrogenase